jgi:hypothetical protein
VTKFEESTESATPFGISIGKFPILDILLFLRN